MEGRSNRNEPMLTIMDLDDASLGNVFDFLPGHLRFVASVNRRFRVRYVWRWWWYIPNTIYTVAMTSDATRAIWLQEDEACVKEKGCILAAKFGNLEALQWFHSRNCSWGGGVCTEAAAGGHLHVLRWARSQTPPCPWDGNTCEAAAENGQLDVLQWLRSQTPPCPWGRYTCAAAAGHGQLDTLKWLRSQTPPCPWDRWVCVSAAKHGQLVALQWLRSQTPPCPWGENACVILLLDMANWMC